MIINTFPHLTRLRLAFPSSFCTGDISKTISEKRLASSPSNQKYLKISSLARKQQIQAPWKTRNDNKRTNNKMISICTKDELQSLIMLVLVEIAFWSVSETHLHGEAISSYLHANVQSKSTALYSHPSSIR